MRVSDVMKWSKIILGFILILLATGYAIFIRFTNADMTDTRLLIEYWKIYLGILIVIFIGYILAMSELK